MENVIRPQINKIRQLVSDIARVGSLDPPRSTRTQEDLGTPASRALAVSPPETLEGRILKVIVKDNLTKEELGQFIVAPLTPTDTILASRLYDTKLNLLELCDRQLEDLIAAESNGSSREVEDADKLFAEMTGVFHCMEAIASIERVLTVE